MQPRKKQMRNSDREYVTFEIKPSHDSFFPDLDLVFWVSGSRWKKFGAQFDGKLWRVTLYDVPKGACFYIVRAGTNEQVDARRVNDNDVNG